MLHRHIGDLPSTPLVRRHLPVDRSPSTVQSIGLDPCPSPSLHGSLSPGTMVVVSTLSILSPGIISNKCWMINIKRSISLVKQISLLETISTCSAATSYGCRSSGVFYAVDSATLQPVLRCTPAPYGTLAAPAVLPTQTSPKKHNKTFCHQSPPAG